MSVKQHIQQISRRHNFRSGLLFGYTLYRDRLKTFCCLTVVIALLLCHNLVITHSFTHVNSTGSVTCIQCILGCCITFA